MERGQIFVETSTLTSQDQKSETAGLRSANQASNVESFRILVRLNFAWLNLAVPPKCPNRHLFGYESAEWEDLAVSPRRVGSWCLRVRFYS